MSPINRRRPWAIAAASVAALAAAVPALPAQAEQTASKEVPLVVRGQDTLSEGECDAAAVCRSQITGGQFRGTPVSTGTYDGTVNIHVGQAFPNGEGGVCAPVDGRLRLGTGTPDRLVLALKGDSCQDGEGDLTTASFTGLVRFSIKGGTGKYANARGSGLASFLEGADDRERVTLIGRLKG
jgi:hypothetical protein